MAVPNGDLDVWLSIATCHNYLAKISITARGTFLGFTARPQDDPEGEACSIFHGINYFSTNEMTPKPDETIMIALEEASLTASNLWHLHAAPMAGRSLLREHIAR